MFTTNLEDGREAPSKARKKGAKRLEFLVYYTLVRWLAFMHIPCKKKSWCKFFL